MSKVYMIFLFLLSGTVQLSYTQETLPKIYGRFYFFDNGTLNSVVELNNDQPSITNIFSSERVLDDNWTVYRLENIYNVDILEDGTCYFTCLFLKLDKNGAFVESLNIRGVGVCQPNQKIVRWHMKAEQTVNGWSPYDFVFVRDPKQVITEKNLNQLSPTPMIGHKLL